MKQMILFTVVGTLLLGASSGCGDGEPKIIMPTARYPPAPREGITVGGGSSKPRAQKAPAEEVPELLSPPAPEKPLP